MISHDKQVGILNITEECAYKFFIKFGFSKFFGLNQILHYVNIVYNSPAV
jgi:hypothetical protein